MSIDLDLFCDRECRTPGCDLSVPFSLNEHSYASNGHICVRVPRRSDIAENTEAPNAEQRLPWNFSRVTFAPLPKLKLLEKCGWCAGRGHQHNCPDCQCECEHCDGSGKRSVANVRIGKAYFAGPYIEWIQALPGVEIGKPHPSRPLAFRFTGGDGLLMPLKVS